MSYRQISYYTDKPILSKKDICMSYVVKKPMSGQPYLQPTHINQFPLVGVSQMAALGWAVHLPSPPQGLLTPSIL